MLIRSILSSLSKKEITRPVFILGCGRSGTTILGKTLSKHRCITYLNERRDLWFKAYQETDIWTLDASARNGKLKLTPDNTDNVRSLKLRRLFYKETIKTSRPVLVEKLPINNFRVEFIQSIFPDARFIHIYRNGLEVAKSIQKISEEGGWFGSNDYKWKQLKGYAKSYSVTSKLPDLCDSYYYKGLLEWRLSTESAIQFLSKLPDDKYMEISYATLSNMPLETVRQVLAFIEISDDLSVEEFVCKNISRRTKNLNNSRLTDLESRLGGKLLPISLDSTSDGLTNEYIRTK